MAYERIELSELPPKLRMHCDPAGPAPPRMMAAKGIAPLNPVERVTVLYCLLTDPQQDIAQAASKSFGSLPENIFKAALGGAVDGRILGFVLGRLKEGDARREIILRNPRLPDNAIAEFAAVCEPSLTEIIADNQQRWLAAPEIVRGLHNNPRILRSVMDRVVEMAQREGLKVAGVPGLDDGAAAEPPPAVTPEAEAASEEEYAPALEETGVEEEAPLNYEAAPAELVAQAAGALPDLPPEILAQLPPEALAELASGAFQDGLDDELFEEETLRPGHQQKKAEEPDEQLTTTQKLMKMSIAQKIVLAQRGNKEIRTMLSRETNKLILMSVVNSPRITDGEIEKMASNRSMPADVIRRISCNNEWVKDYSIRLRLIYNPKTDVKLSTKWLNLLQPKDLKDLAKSKGVPAIVTTTARKLMQTKSSRKH